MTSKELVLEHQATKKKINALRAQMQAAEGVLESLEAELLNELIGKPDPEYLAELQEQSQFFTLGHTVVCLSATDGHARILLWEAEDLAQ